MAARAPVERRRVRVSGVVQGVGFRPFVHALARSHALAGHVRNDGECVIAAARSTASPRRCGSAGAELKGTFCVADGSCAWLSPHLGDLDSPARQAFAADLDLHVRMLALRPEVVACDMHPDYASTRWTLEQDAELVRVQHHHAHAAACVRLLRSISAGLRARGFRVLAHRLVPPNDGAISYGHAAIAAAGA